MTTNHVTPALRQKVSPMEDGWNDANLSIIHVNTRRHHFVYSLLFKNYEENRRKYRWTFGFCSTFMHNLIIFRNDAVVVNQATGQSMGCLNIRWQLVIINKLYLYFDPKSQQELIFRHFRHLQHRYLLVSFFFFLLLLPL